MTLNSLKESIRRILRAGVAVVLAASPVETLAEGPSAASVIVFDAGQPRRFEVARDEFHITDRTGATALQRLEVEPSLDRLRARAKRLAAATGVDVRLVLYPPDHPRNGSTRRLLTRKILLRLAPDTAAEAVLNSARDVGRWWRVDYLPGAVMVEARDAADALAVADSLRARPGVLAADVQLARQRQPRFLPNDKLFADEWHLLNSAQYGVDVNITNVWDTYHGNGVVIGIVDDGLQTSHPDLAPNYSAALSYDFDDNDPDPSPTSVDDGHGTSCAGIAAARGNNLMGVCGAAFEATLAGLRLIAAPTTDDMEASAMLANNQAIHIKNNSWGPPDDGTDLYGIGPLANAALATGTQTGRGGRGTIYVFAAGNGLAGGDDANYGGYANSIYVIPVGAVNDQGLQATYSTPGACVVVSAPSGDFDHLDIFTTDLMGTSGYNTGQTPSDLQDKDYTQYFAGTSASAPLVSGITALLLQANPNLGWRDVKEILMRSATKNAATDGDWATNSAGFHFNHKFGAGLVNTRAAVTAALTWNNLPPATNQFAAVNGVDLAIPDASSAGVNVPFVFTNDALRVEHIRLTVDLVHPRRGDVAITLTSPGGMKSRLTELHGDTNENFYSWPLSSVHHWGETSTGTWTVKVADLQPGNTGRLISLRLELLGTPVNPLIATPTAAKEVDGQANGNGALDPGETVEETITLRNAGSTTLGSLSVTLTTTTPGVTLLQPGSAYPALAPGNTASNSAGLSYRVAKNVPCGTVIRFALVSTNQTVRLTNYFSQIVGQPGQANAATDSFESADAPKTIPDLTTTLSTNVIAAPANRVVDDVKVSLRLDHTAVGDLQIALVHPDGTEVLIADHEGGNNPDMGAGTCGAGEVRTVFDDAANTAINTGATPFAGAYRPDNPLALLRGKALAGIWRLRLSDQYSNDSGRLLCWGLQILSHDQTVACSVFNPPPLATNLNLTTSINIDSSGALAAADIDGDPITFQIVAPPAHGRLVSFDAATGRFTYQPDPNYAGSDAFNFRANDGLTNSEPATVNITVNPTGPIFTGFEHLGDGRFVLRVLAPPGPPYVIESSTNLTNWLPIATNTSPATAYDFMDGDAPSYPLRFYRVRQ